MTDSRVVCPHCATTNSLPAERLGDGPNCGKCHDALFAARPAELSAGTLDRHLARSDIPVLVDFWAPWCGPCLAMAPAFEEAAAAMEPAVRFAKLNTEQEQLVGAQHGVRSIPTIILFVGGQEVARHSGAMMAGDIVRWVNAQLN